MNWSSLTLTGRFYFLALMKRPQRSLSVTTMIDIARARPRSEELCPLPIPVLNSPERRLSESLAHFGVQVALRLWGSFHLDSGSMAIPPP